jgi:signal peptidase I
MSTTTEQTDHPEETEEVEPEAKTIEREKKKFHRRVVRRQRGFFVLDVVVVAATIATVAAAVIAFIPFVVQLSFNWGYDEVTSGSMSGTFETGEIIITAPYVGENLEVGQVVRVQGEGTRYVHRIVVVNEDGTFITKGDANENTDLIQPTKSDVRGTYVSYLEGPEAWFVTVFSPDKVWADEVFVAAQAGEWDVVIDHIPSAPWGFLALLVAVIVFFWFVPDFRQYLQNKALAKQTVDFELLKRSVAVAQQSINEQQSAIDEHDEAINEVVPVVEEIQQERETAKAEREAAEAAQEEMWGNWNPAAPIYDEPEDDDYETSLPVVAAPTVPVASTVTEVPMPALPELEDEFDASAFVRELAARHNTSVAPSGDGLRDELPPLASLPVTRAGQSRPAHRAFTTEEE